MIRALVALGVILGTGRLGDDDDGAPGCGNRMVDVLHESCDDGNTRSGDGCSSTCETETVVTVHWTIENSAGEPQPCSAMFDTVEVTRISARASGSPIPFRCEDGQAHLEWLDAPRNPAFAVRLQLVSNTSHEVFAETMVPLSSVGIPLDLTGTLVIQH